MEIFHLAMSILLIDSLPIFVGVEIDYVINICFVKKILRGHLVQFLFHTFVIFCNTLFIAIALLSQHILPVLLLDWLHRLPKLFTDNSELINFYFLFILFVHFLLVLSSRLSWLLSPFECTLQQHLISHRSADLLLSAAVRLIGWGKVERSHWSGRSFVRRSFPGCFHTVGKVCSFDFQSVTESVIHFICWLDCCNAINQIKHSRCNTMVHRSKHKLDIVRNNSRAICLFKRTSCDVCKSKVK